MILATFVGDIVGFFCTCILGFAICVSIGATLAIRALRSNKSAQAAAKTAAKKAAKHGLLKAIRWLRSK